MRALTFRAVGRLAVEEVPDPRLVDPGDAVVRVRLAAICGSDLHPYRGREVGLDAGTVMGHELVGEVVEVGADVRLRPGAVVVSPFTTSCGECFYCARGLTARCERGQLLGWVEQGRGLHGAQAELVRVPLADSTLVEVPPGAPEDEALLAGDVLSTGFFCAELGGAAPGRVVAVVGAGPVGLCAAVAARELGAERVFAFESVPERLDLARAFGATPADVSAPDHREPLLEATGGRGADVVLECVGSPGATRAAWELARPGATIAAAGVHTETSLAFTPGEAYDKNLTYRAGRCSARAVMDRTLPLVAEGRLGLAGLLSHRLPLEEGPRGYEIFENRLEGCTKVLLIP